MLEMTTPDTAGALRNGGFRGTEPRWRARGNASPPGRHAGTGE